MTYDEFGKYLRRADVSAKEFAEMLNKHPNSITNNASRGKVPNELGVIAVLMSELAYRDIEFKSIVRKLDLPRQKSRGIANKKDLVNKP